MEGPLAGRELALIWDNFCTVILYFAFDYVVARSSSFFSLLHVSCFLYVPVPDVLCQPESGLTTSVAESWA